MLKLGAARKEAGRAWSLVDIRHRTTAGYATLPTRILSKRRRGLENNRESNERQRERVSPTSWFRYAVSRSSLCAFPFRKCSESCSA